MPDSKNGSENADKMNQSPNSVSSNSDREIDSDLEWTYSKSPESRQNIEINENYDHFIGGEFTKPVKNRYLKSINPANGELLAEFAEGTSEDVEKAVKSARLAFKKWSELPGKDRGKYTFRLARLIQERSKEFAVTETMDGGKPIRESRDIDIPLAAAHFFYYAGWADKLNYAFPGREAVPVGVCGQIIPWNFPLLMLAWKIAPALATGNTVVLKPAESTPLTALKFAELCHDAQLPDGVVNIVTGTGQTGSLIVNHPGIDKIAFTGSTKVGKIIQKDLAGTDKKFTLELGGKGANIIFDDAPIDQAVEGVIDAIFFNQGHVCCAGSRLLVQENIADNFTQKLKTRMETLIIGDPLDKNTDIGAIHSRDQFNKINKYLEIGQNEGAKMYQSGQTLPKHGYYCKPTLFTNVSQSNRIVREEIFGPVLTIQTFRTPEEAIDKANNSPYGLAGGVWTDKGSKIFKAGSEMQSGVVWANTYNKFDPTSPFGGIRESGIGREGGLHGLYPYVTFRQNHI
jgi:aldehyde dehydrogenase (NAD+)